jgi:hypothetical protein
MTDGALFELTRFSAEPVSDGVAVVEVDGRFAEGALNGEAPRLLVEDPSGEQLELPAIGPERGEDGRWHATFAVPAGRLADSAFCLALRDLLLDLPAPDTTGPPPGGDRLVALTRELNAMRRRVEEAEAAQRERDEARSELRDARRQLKAVRAEAEALRRERDQLARELQTSETAVVPRRPVAPTEPIPQHEAAAFDELEPGEPVERVRILGPTGPRRVHPTDVLPPVDATIQPAPPVLAYTVAAIVFVMFVVVLMLLLL